MRSKPLVPVSKDVRNNLPTLTWSLSNTALERDGSSCRNVNHWAQEGSNVEAEEMYRLLPAAEGVGRVTQRKTRKGKGAQQRSVLLVTFLGSSMS